MSRYANNYRDAGQMPLFDRKSQYDSMMYGKRDIADLGARLLAEYRNRYRSF
jgi:hypothetical protein